jgi:hypothetical protein
LQKPNAAIVKIEFEELIIEEAPIDISGFSAPEIDQILLGDDAPALEQEAAISRMWAASERLTLRAGTTSSAGARSSIDNRGTRSLRRAVAKPTRWRGPSTDRGDVCSWLSGRSEASAIDRRHVVRNETFYSPMSAVVFRARSIVRPRKAQLRESG